MYITFVITEFYEKVFHTLYHLHACISLHTLGEAMERGLRECCRSIRIGKILIRHDPDTNEAKLYYAKFPSDIDKMNILLLFPNLGETIIDYMIYI